MKKYEIEVEYNIEPNGGFRAVVTCVKAPEPFIAVLWKGYKSQIHLHSPNDSWDNLEERVERVIEEAKAEIDKRRTEIPPKKIFVL